MHLEQREPPLSTSTQVPSLAKRTRLTHAKRVLPFFHEAFAIALSNANNSGT
jgi:hypothetical protein